jgi:hypothetical protein
LGKAYTTRRYEMQIEQGKPKRAFLVPVKANAFENRAAFEEIKAGGPPLVKGIIPL